MQEIDQAIAWGRARKIHVNLCLHRAPGYCVNPPKESLNLWADDEGGEEARRQFAAQWAMFAARYKGIPSDQLSFDLVNEPADVSAAAYTRAVTSAVTAIRASDPTRLIVADGLRYGNDPVPELAPLKIAQSTRGYAPMQVSHYKASWVQASAHWKLPSWPLIQSSGPDGKRATTIWDRARLQREQITPWLELQQKHQVGVHVGEWGAFNQTPHSVALAWMLDQLTLWREANWGWALWNLRGPFGILNSGRADVNYEKFKNYQLDRQMLELLRHG